MYPFALCKKAEKHPEKQGQFMIGVKKVAESEVAVLMDMGSAVMTTEMVIEALGYDDVVMLDGPIVEGAIVAALESALGTPLEKLQAKVDEARETRKLDLTK